MIFVFQSFFVISRQHNPSIPNKHPFYLCYRQTTLKRERVHQSCIISIFPIFFYQGQMIKEMYQAFIFQITQKTREQMNNPIQEGTQSSQHQKSLKKYGKSQLPRSILQFQPAIHLISNFMTIQFTNTQQVSNIYEWYLTKPIDEDYQQQDPINIFFNPQALMDNFLPIKIIQEYASISNIQHDQNNSLSSRVDETATIKVKKSIFHNFQKHLITLVKKYVNFGNQKGVQQKQMRLAIRLWNTFLKQRSFNKKILHIIFGVLENHKGEQYQKFIKNFPSFQAIYTNNLIEQIEKSQKIIRETVVKQLQTLSKQTLTENSQMNRFEQFYLYFKSFVQELKCGAMTRRMTKKRKNQVLNRLINREFQQDL